MQLKFYIFYDPCNKKPRWNIEKADWILFSTLAIPPQVSVNSLDVNNGCKAITESILSAAESAIPRTGNFLKRPSVPWFSKECKEAVKKRRTALKNFQKNMTTANFIEYKKQRSVCRRTLNLSKKESWTSFVTSINSSTSSSIVWNKIRKIKGTSSAIRYTLQSDGRLYDDPGIVSNIFSEFYSNIYKEPLSYDHTHNIVFTTDDESLDYNSPFTMWELQSVLKSVKGSSPGPDNHRTDGKQKTCLGARKEKSDSKFPMWF